MRLPTSSACVNGIVSVVNRFFIIFTLQSLDKLRNLMTKSTGQLIMYLQQKSIINMWKKLANYPFSIICNPGDSSGSSCKKSMIRFRITNTSLKRH